MKPVSKKINLNISLEKLNDQILLAKSEGNTTLVKLLEKVKAKLKEKKD